MKFQKYYVRLIDSGKTFVCTKHQLLGFILNHHCWPIRIVPIAADGNLVHAFSFVVGDEFTLSFLLNDKTIKL